MLKKAQISKGKAITAEEGKGILQRKWYWTGQWKYKFYMMDGKTEFAWLPVGEKERVALGDVEGRGVPGEAYGAWADGERHGGWGESAEYRLTQDGEKAARMIPFTYSIYRDIAARKEKKGKKKEKRAKSPGRDQKPREF